MTSGRAAKAGPRSLAVRLGAAALGAVSVLAGGAWLGGAFAPAALAAPGGARHGTEGQPGYPGRTRGEALALGERLSVNGQPMRLSVFFTADPPAKVVAWYREALARKGLVPVARAEAQLAHLSVFDPEDGLQRSISALPQPGGETLVLVSATDPRKPPRLSTGPGRAAFPVPEEHRAYLAYDSEDAGARAQSAHFVTALAPATVIAWYRTRLGALGFSEEAAGSSPGLALFRKEAVSIAVAAQSLDARGGAVVFVNRVEGGAR